MEQREKLIELISPLMLPKNAFLPTTAADYLLANGVVVLPCRCEECSYHDHDGATGYCNYWRRWSNMSGYCNHGKRKGDENEENSDSICERI